jgi:hypothetical protein
VSAERLPAMRLRTDPSCRLVSSSFPVLSIWQVNQPDHHGGLQVDFDGPPDRLRIRREPDGVALERIGAAEFNWLAALLDGAPLAAAIERAQAANATFDLGTALHRFIGDATIAGLDDR